MTSFGTNLGTGAAPPSRTAPPIEVIDSSNRASLRTTARELWRHRDLILILTRRDVSVRYKQAVFGLAWAVIQPLALVAVFSFFLNRSGQAAPDAVPYAAFALAGLIPWTFVSSSVLTGGDSLVTSANLVSKVYFPRLALPASALASWLPDLALSTGVLGVLMGVYRIVPGPSILALPGFVALAALTALGVAVWAAALNVAYRDVKHAVPFLVQFWLFATPVIYTAHHFEGAAGALVSINPMTATVVGFRWALLGVGPPSWASVLVSAASSLLILAAGLRYFGRTERYFADVV